MSGPGLAKASRVNLLHRLAKLPLAPASITLFTSVAGVGRNGLDQYQGSRLAFAALLGQDRRGPPEGHGMACEQRIEVIE